MTIGVSFKRAINTGFIHTIFRSKDENVIKNTLNTKINGSAKVSLLPTIPKVEVEQIDDNHTALTLVYDDYAIKGIVTWKPTANGFVFMSYE
jgi:hypothetical protein